MTIPISDQQVPPASEAAWTGQTPLPPPAAAPPRSRRLIARNFLSLSAASVLLRVINLFAGVYTRRVFGAVAMGQLNWAGAVISYFTLAANPGAETIARREVARDPRQAPRLIGLLFLVQLILGVASVALVCVIAFCKLPGPQIGLLLILQSITLLLLPFNVSWLLIANERMTVASLLDVLASLATVGGLFLLIRGPEHLVRYVVYAYPIRAAQQAFVLWYVFHVGLLRWKDVVFSLKGSIWLVKEAIPLGLSSVAILLYYNSDAIILGIVRDSRTVGIYATAYGMMLVPTVLSSSLLSAFFPALTRSVDDPEHATRTSREFLRAMAWIGFPLAALGWAFGRDAAPAVYGHDFTESGPLFQWLSLNLTLIFFNVAYGQPLIAWNRQSAVLWITVAGAGTNLLLNLVAIPLYGAWGAVATTIAAEVVVAIAIVRVRRKVMPLDWLSAVSIPFIVSAMVALFGHFVLLRFRVPWWVSAGACAAILGAAGLIAEWRVVQMAIAPLRRRRAAKSESASLP
ncbi:MAG: polysaccharide biosynthesis protein [Phycisphaerales bacterium]|nr:polysaccharide biosynthesis protein [Phycisphaerales bacterium]